jgi:poly-gamma-glutamate capsule biosynthesis protein CapA/YwtB (metallophosphatase superfamily)
MPAPGLWPRLLRGLARGSMLRDVADQLDHPRGSIEARGRAGCAVLVLALLLLAAGAGGGSAARPEKTVTLVFGGDVMLGRGVAPLLAQAPGEAFAGVRFELAGPDLAIANLESPLTLRPHLASRGPNALEAKPGSARLLKAAGFDAMSIANNHAGDAGPGTVPDTIRALSAQGIATLGGGETEADAYRPQLLDVHGVRVALLSFDATGQGPRAGRATAGVAWWSAARVREAVRRARAEADVVVVGLHGGAEYETRTGRWMRHLAGLLSTWGADVVWGSGPHVVQPTSVIRQKGGRATVVSPSLGNLLFDQHLPGTRQGELLEVLAGADGVRAYRLGTTLQQPSNAVVFGRWLSPRGDAVALAGDWWGLARKVSPVRVRRPGRLVGFPGKVVSAAIGDVEGNGSEQLVVSFWRPYRRTDVNALLPRSRLVDRRGLTAHVGLYEPATRRELWVAGTLLRPVLRLAPCDGTLAVAYSTLNGSTVVGAGAWRWRGFGFTPLPDLPGRGTPACADVDRDGRLDPLILRRTP